MLNRGFCIGFWICKVSREERRKGVVRVVFVVFGGFFRRSLCIE